ncbi:MAG: type II toxin-antitoxin system HicA family toxin [Candidatus Methanoperedens sp.]|nr:type II toxin-antitoxin system HicA family toxin [Candidatus Methanoperedens sp.]
MTKLPSVSSQKVIKALFKAGFDYAPIKGKGSHTALVRVNQMGQKFLVIVSKRDPVPKGTLISIIKQSGLSRDEFINLLK